MPAELRRVLTLRDLVLIVVGTTIGSGIFTVPGAVLRQSGGDLGVALVVWVVGSVLALLGALTFGELGAMLPDAGGSYVYVREAFGSLPAFLLGWALFLAINTGSTATLAVARELSGRARPAPAGGARLRRGRHDRRRGRREHSGRPPRGFCSELEHGAEGGSDPRARCGRFRARRRLSRHGHARLHNAPLARVALGRRRRAARRAVGVRRVAKRDQFRGGGSRPAAHVRARDWAGHGGARGDLPDSERGLRRGARSCRSGCDRPGRGRFASPAIP